MTLPEVTASPAWVPAARDAWLPREGRAEPLRVDAWMRSPVAFDLDDGLRLDGAVAWVVVALTTSVRARVEELRAHGRRLTTRDGTAAARN